MKVGEFDEAFERGEDILEYLDFANARRPNQDIKRVNVDFPIWMVDSLDREAKRLGVSLQSIIKDCFAHRLEKPTK